MRFETAPHTRSTVLFHPLRIQQRYQTELESARTRATTSSAALQNAIDSALLNQRKEHLFEISQLKESHAQALDDLTRRAALREAGERERADIEKDTWSAMIHAKVQREAAEKERQAKAALQKEQAEEIELIIEKLSKENETQCKEIVRDYEKKIESLRRSALGVHMMPARWSSCCSAHLLSDSSFSSPSVHFCRQTSGDASSSQRAVEESNSKYGALARKHAALEEQYTGQEGENEHGR
jgi:alanyl-tRNA synthetase